MASEPLRLLVVVASPEERERLRAALTRAGVDAVIEEAPEPAAAVAIAGSGGHDGIVIDQAGLAVIAGATAAAAAHAEMIGIIAHDLRNPINAITLACDALAEAEVSSAQRLKYVGAIRRATGRTDRLLRDLLDVAAIERGELRVDRYPVSIAAIVELSRAEHEQAFRDAEMTLGIDVAPDAGRVIADRDLIVRVLGNLLGNTLKHAKRSAVEVAVCRVGDLVEVAVRDHGTGIPAATLPHIFDRNWQSRRQRRGGLGLTIARGIVEAHGGTIDATSTVGEGSRFAFRLPAAG